MTLSFTHYLIQQFLFSVQPTWIHLCWACECTSWFLNHGRRSFLLWELSLCIPVFLASTHEMPDVPQPPSPTKIVTTKNIPGHLSTSFRGIQLQLRITALEWCGLLVLQEPTAYQMWPAITMHSRLLRMQIGVEFCSQLGSWLVTNLTLLFLSLGLWTF